MLRFFIYISIALGCFAAAIGALVASVLLSTPRPDNIRDCIIAKMHEVKLCPKDKSYARLNQISPYIRHAVLVSEDSGFYAHNGLDFHELRMSFETNLKEGRFARGGSTITQQLAKNVYLSAEKSLFRKAREALIALQIEKILKKDEILEKYLNVVEFGPNVYGVRKATQFYFSKQPNQVTVLEGAWLAFVLPNPKKYSQSFRKRQLTKFAHHQLKVIVERMARFKRISADEANEALIQLSSMFRPAEETEEVISTEEAQALDEGIEETTLEDGSNSDTSTDLESDLDTEQATPEGED